MRGRWEGMRRSRTSVRHGLMALASLLTAVSALALIVTPARAGTVSLPFPNFYRITVELAVFDVSGATVETLQLQGASGMVLSRDKLYVAETDGPAIAVVDTSSDPPAVTRTIGIGSYTQPRELTHLKHRLWFTSAQGIGSVHLDGTGLLDPPLWQPAGVRFADGLVGRDRLVVFTQSCGTIVDQYVAAPSPRLIRETWNFAGLCYVQQMAVVPGGASVVTATSGVCTQVSLLDDSIVQTYDCISPGSQAVAVTSAHGGMVAGGSTGDYGPAVAAYRLRETTPFFTYEYSTSSRDELDGLAWSGGGDKLYMVGWIGGALSLETIDVMNLPSVGSSGLTIDPLGHVRTGDVLDITVHLGDGDTDRDVTLAGWPVGGAPTTLATGAVDGNGDLMVPLTASVSMTLVASYAGDAFWGPAETALDVPVRSTTNLIVKAKRFGSDGRYPILDQPLTLKVALQPPVGGNEVDFAFQRRTHGVWQAYLDQQSTYVDSGSSSVSIDWFSSGTYRVRAVSSTTESYLGSRSPWYRFEL